MTGPFVARLIFHIFVVVVGTLILSGAVNTAIVGSNGVLNRVSEDGVLSGLVPAAASEVWNFAPDYQYGRRCCKSSTILISRGDVTFLANLYAFGVIWSFALKGIAVLVLRYTHPQDREFRVPLNFHIAGVEIPLGLGIDHADAAGDCRDQPFHEAGGNRFGNHLLRLAIRGI